MRTIVPMVVALLIGAALGAGATTAGWSGILKRSQAQTKAAYDQFEQAMTIAKSNLATAQSCAAALNRLTRINK